MIYYIYKFVNVWFCVCVWFVSITMNFVFSDMMLCSFSCVFMIEERICPVLLIK
jgi:hypothetical protein